MKKTHIMKLLVSLSVIVFTSSACFGFGQEDIAMHGFVSQGYLKSSANKYFSNTEDGTFEYNEIGVNFSAPVTDDLRFGIQLFSRDFGLLGNNDLVVDWAFLDYTLYDWFSFRAGKIKMPYGLYNRKRDADMLRTSIILPQSVYQEGMREFVVAFYGFSLYGTKGIGAAGYVDYEVFVGTFPTATDSAYLDQMTNQLQSVMPAYADIISNINITDSTVEHAEGGSLIWNTPLDGLKLGATFLSGKVMTEGNIPLPDSSTEYFSVENNLQSFSVQSIEYEIGEITFVLEKNQMKMRFETALFPEKMTSEMEGWYGAISWNVLSFLGIGVAYGEYFPDAKNKDGSNMQQLGLADFYNWQKNITLSLRFNINELWCVKLESHLINGLGLAGSGANPVETAEENWQLYAIKTSLSF